MCASVEMLSRCFAEKSLAESIARECAGKITSCTTGKIFQWDNSPISIGGTLHRLSSALGFISL